MANFIVTVTFSEERPIEAETREQAERLAWERYAAEPRALLDGLEVTAEEATGGAAYRRLMAKARCTIDYQAGAALHRMAHGDRVDFIMRQLWLLGVGGYSREEVDRLVKDNFREL